MQGVGRILEVLVGLGLIFFGGVMIVMPLGMATMIDPDTPPGAWWGEYWRALYLGSGIGSIGLGLIAGLLGAWIFTGGWRRSADRSRPNAASADLRPSAKDQG